VDFEMLLGFFMWCTIINGALLGFWTLMFLCAPDLVYRTQRKFFPLSKDQFTLVMYCFLGLFKILFLIFNLVPFIVLLIMGK